MPRDSGTKIYTVPDGTHGVPDAIIESAKYNAFADDLRQDLSAALPIEMGGTASNSRSTALTNLGAISTFLLEDLFVGRIGYFASSSPPEGWLICEGQDVSRSQYSKLFARIGVTYGTGNLTSTFGLPDLRGEFIRGLDQSRGIDSGRTLGSLQAASNKPHSHTGTTSTDGAHTHSAFEPRITVGNDFKVPPADVGQLTGSSSSATTGSSGNHSHTVSLETTGEEFRPRNVALLPCILAFLPAVN